MMLFKRQPGASAAGDGDPAQPSVSVSGTDGATTVALAGNWTTVTVAEMDGRLREIEQHPPAGPVRLDLSGIGRFDTAGAWLVCRTMAALRQSGSTVEVAGADRDVATLMEAVREANS